MSDRTLGIGVIGVGLQGGSHVENYVSFPNANVVAVADVSAWDFWPAKGFVQDAIREEQRKAGHPIFLDWSGEFGKSFRAKNDASNVVLVGPDGKVKLSHAGPVPASKILEILMATGKK